MKRNLLKILPFLLLGGVLGLAAAPAAFEAAVETKAADEQVVSFTVDDFSGKGSASPGSKVTVTKNNVTVTAGNAYGTTQFRVFSGSTFSITSSGFKMSKLDFTFSNSDYTGGLNSSYTIDTNSWSTDTGKLSKQARFMSITVTLAASDATMESIELDTSKAKLNYVQGEKLSTSGVKVTGTMSNESTMVVTDKCTFAPANDTVLSDVGSKTVTVTYPADSTIPTTSEIDLVKTYDITVTEKPVEMVFTLVTDASELAAGDMILIANTAAGKAAQAKLTTDSTVDYKHYLDIDSISISGNNATYGDSSSVCAYTLRTGAKVGTFAFENSDGKYIAPYDAENNGLVLTDSITNEASWTLASSGNDVDMSSVINSTTRYLRYNSNAFRMYGASSAVAKVNLYKYSSGLEKVTLDANAKDVYEGYTNTIKATPSGFAPTSYTWTTSNEAAVKIESGADSATVTVKGVAAGSANLTVTVNGTYTATCVVTCKSAGSLVIEPGDYLITDNTNTHQLVNGAEDMDAYPDFTDINKTWNFEFAGLGDGTYFISNGGKYLIHDIDKGSDLGVSNVKEEYWTITKNSDEETFTLVNSASGNTMVCDPSKSTGTWFAFDKYTGNVAKINLSKTGTLVSVNPTSAPTTKTYNVGDDFKIAGLVIDATFSNGMHANVADKVIWDPLVKGTVATGKITMGAVTLDVTVPDLKIFGPKDDGLTADGIKSQYYIGENVANSIGTVTVTYECGAETKDIVLKPEEYTISPTIIEEGTSSIRISMAKDSTVYKDYNIEAVKNHFVAANYIGAGDVITIGTLGHDLYELKGGEEFTYDGTKFGHESYGYLPTGNQQFEVGKVDGYYTLKNTANGLYLRGDSSSFKKYSELKERVIYKNDYDKYSFDLDVTFKGETYKLEMTSDPNPADLTIEGAIWGWYSDANITIQSFSDLANNCFDLYFYPVSGEDDCDTYDINWRTDGGAFIFSQKGAVVDDPINDEALWSLTYDDYSEAWQMTCKAYPTKQCYWNKDGKFGFYTIGSYDGSQYFNIMLFRDNTKPLQGTLTGVSVSFQEGMDVVSQGEPFPWTSALIVTAYYSGGAFKQVPIGGYQVEIPDTSKIGEATGKVIFGQEGHEVEKEFTITVKGHTQSFEIKGDRDPVLVGEECQLRVEPAAPEGEPIKWSVDHPEFASISETGLLKGIAPGYINVTATSFDGVHSDTVKIRIYQQVESVTLNIHEVTLNAGETNQLSATVLPADASNKNVEYSSSNSSVAFVDAKTGLITAVSEGTATITCAAENHPERNFDTCEVTVKPAPIVHVTGITLDCDYKELELNKTFTLVATITPSNATVKGVTWSSNHDNIATVDSTGKVKGVATGECVITATTADGGKTASCTVKVKKTVTPVPVTSISLDITSKKIDVDETFEIVATINPSDATDKHIDWSSSNEDVVEIISVGPSGVTVKGMSDGTATITASCGGKTATCKVTVGDQPTPPPTPVTHVESVTLSESKARVAIDGTYTLIATINPSDADNKKVTWSSSDTSVATVKNGIVTGIAAGTATITVKTADGGKTATCTITVFDKVEQAKTNAIIAGSVGGTVAVGAGCGIGIPLGLKAKKRKLLK